MEFTVFEPVNEKLKKYISYYYVGTLKDPYFAFPHYNTPLAILKSSDVSIKDKSISIFSNDENKSAIVSLRKGMLPCYVHPKSSVADFSIVFKPYGLAQFLEKPGVMFGATSFFEVVELNEFMSENPLFFNCGNTAKVKLLECYLVNKLVEKKHVAYVVKAIEKLEDETISIQDVVASVPLSAKTFLRAFKLNCGTTPVKMRRIIQFRNALEKIKAIDESFNLSEVAFDSGYYDQANFNKEFKKMSSQLPSQFFQEVRALSSKDIYFKLDD